MKNKFLPTAGEAQLLENNGKEQIAYDSVVLPPVNLSVFGSKLSMRIIKELVKDPGCAMDVARSLGEHEQKIYYHLRRLEEAGIVKLKSKEKRYGMTAKIFCVVSPVIATKLHDGGHVITTHQTMRNPRLEKLLHPFVDERKLNALIILGDPYSHGRFDSVAIEGSHVFDLGLLLGTLINNLAFPNYKLDTQITEKDLRQNLILIGNAKTNTVIDKINKKMPVTFDEKNDFNVISKISGKTYADTRIGVIVKFNNPFKKGKKILLIGGKTRERGIRSSVIALTQHINALLKGIKDYDSTHFIVQGYDRLGNRTIDSVKIIEKGDYIGPD